MFPKFSRIINIITIIIYIYTLIHFLMREKKYFFFPEGLGNYLILSTTLIEPNYPH